MSADAIERAARADRDAQPLTETDLARMQRTPQAKIIRRALELTQEEFAARYHIPLGTLRDWEQGRAEPDQPTRAYLTHIEFKAELKSTRAPVAVCCARIQPLGSTITGAVTTLEPYLTSSARNTQAARTQSGPSDPSRAK